MGLRDRVRRLQTRAQDVAQQAKTVVVSAAGLANDSPAARLRATVEGALKRLSPTQTIAIDALRRSILTHADLVSLALHVESDALVLDAELPNGSRAVARLSTPTFTSAMGGAKEFSLSVEPAQLASRVWVRAAVASVADVLARRIWPFAVTEAHASTPPLATHEGNVLRIDLRELPSVSGFFRRGEVTMLVEAMRVRELGWSADGLVCTLGLATG